MLKSLSIKNYAIIDDVSIEFGNGFHVFTGETGAGKSIIVGALSHLLKGRSDSSLIRQGAARASVEGVFTLDEDLKEKLDEAMIDHEDEVIVRRILSADNRNIIKVNDTNVTLTFLEKLFENKVDIHSQKDSLYLFNPKNHLSLLDRYCGSREMLKSYKEKYDSYSRALREYRELSENTYSQRDYEYYRFDHDELAEAKLSLEEEEELHQKEKRYKQSEKYLTVLSNAAELYKGEGGIKERFYALIKELTIDDEHITAIRESLENLYYELEDKTSELEDILSSFEDDDLNIEYIEERLFLYSKLKRKHGTDTQGLLDLQEDLKQKIALYEDRDLILAEKQKQLDLLKKNAWEEGKKISVLRSNKARELEKLIEKECQDLVLPNVHFEVSIEEKELSPDGIDNVEFYVSMNKGDSLRPLKNVVSGGEASRLLLALKTIFTGLSSSTLVVFDEIDSGVSGKVAFAVGQKMKKIAQNTQVLTITHLAPVAAAASRHFYIYKEDGEKYTSTRIRELKGKEIIRELANISSDINEDSLRAAEQLYRKAQEDEG